MSKKSTGSLDAQPSVLSDPSNQRYQKNLVEAEQLLAAYQRGEQSAVSQFEERHPQGKKVGFKPTLQDARLLVSGRRIRATRLSLEKLKKEAKDLVKQLKAGHAEAIDRLFQFHPKGSKCDFRTAKLADAQSIIARENGFGSWARLKAHFECLQQANTHLQQPHLELDHDLKTLHIRCGSDIQTTLQGCGFTGEFLEISNPFPQGQVPPYDPLDDFVKTRRDFIVQTYAADIPPEYADKIGSAESEIRSIEQRLRSLPKEIERIVLWFEHDPFDQLCLAYVLAHLVNNNMQNCRLELVQVDSFPGIEKFIGLGYLCQHPENLVLLWQQRIEITPKMMAFGARCWKAYSGADPKELWQLSQEASPLPLMQKAMLRMLQELPWKNNGLSLTEQLGLEIVRRDGPLNMARAFHFLIAESEPLAFLGDIMFLAVMRPLWLNKNAALNVVSHDPSKPAMRRDTVEISDLGRDLLNGQRDWLDVCGSEYQRWVGNIPVSQGDKQWVWCPQKGQPLLLS